MGCSLLVILAALVAYGTAAYFTAETRATNVITTGTIDIELVETTTGGAEWPEEGITGVMPGMSVDKQVTVKNNGTADAWIRVKVTSEIKKANGGDLPLILDNGEPVLNIDFNNEWGILEDKKGDGVYYVYKEPVAPGDSTDELFTEVTFNPAMDNKYQGCTANVRVQAQAVQYKNNGDQTHDDYSDVKGWPAD